MRKILMCFCLSLLYLNLFGQKEYGGHPMGLIQESLKSKISVLQLNGLTKSEIEQFHKDASGILPFAAPISLDCNYIKKATLTKDRNGNRLYRLAIELNKSKANLIRFSSFELSKGARLFFYDKEGKQIHGAYTDLNNLKSKKFISPEIKGEYVVVELFEPANAHVSKLKISKIYQVLDGEKPPISDHPFQVKSMEMDTGFMSSLVCHVNINCPLGDDWQDEKRGIVRIMMVLEEGLGWCTGSLINNTEEDGRPLLLTAYHCQYSYTPDYDLWRFDFMYESETCETQSTEPDKVSLLGCIYNAGRLESDFMLLELTETIPQNVDAYFNGWNRDANALPQNGTIIHHPSGDVKKISFDQNTVIVHPNPIGWNNGVTTPAGYHFKATLDQGTMQGGSSGCPLMNQNGHIVAQLHGGIANCNTFITYNGRLSKSWDDTTSVTHSLESWLDPLNSDVISLDGMENPIPEDFDISGYIMNPNQLAMPNVEVRLEGDTSLTVFTDMDGFYIFRDINPYKNYTVSSFKDGNDANGISALDLILIQKHILNLQPFNDPIKEQAADANNSDSNSASDLVQIQKVNLGLSDDFPNATSWEFRPQQIQINNLASNYTQQNFIGVKIGDVNFSADPAE